VCVGSVYIIRDKERGLYTGDLMGHNFMAH